MSITTPHDPIQHAVIRLRTDTSAYLSVDFSQSFISTYPPLKNVWKPLHADVHSAHLNGTMFTLWPKSNGTFELQAENSDWWSYGYTPTGDLEQYSYQSDFGISANGISG